MDVSARLLLASYETNNNSAEAVHRQLATTQFKCACACLSEHE